MKTSRNLLSKYLKAIGKLVGRVLSELVKDVIAYIRRRKRLIQWPDTSTAATLW